MKIQYKKIVLLIVIWCFTVLSAHALTMDEAIRELQDFGVFDEKTSDSTKKATGMAYIYHRAMGISPEKASKIKGIPVRKIENGQRYEAMLFGKTQVVLDGGEWKIEGEDDEDGNTVYLLYDPEKSKHILTKSQYDNSSKNDAKPAVSPNTSDQKIVSLSQAEQKILANDLAKKMGLDSQNIKYTTIGTIPVTINGQAVPDNLYTAEQKKMIETAKSISASMGNTGKNQGSSNSSGQNSGLTNQGSSNSLVQENSGQTSAGGDSQKQLVNCGGEGQSICTICHLIEGIHGVIAFLVKLMVIVAITVITIAGVMYIISAGDTGMTGKAKKAVINTLVGITVVLVAFMSITVILNRVFNANDTVLVGGGLNGMASNAWTFKCDKTSNVGQTTDVTTTRGESTTGGGTSYPSTGDEKAARDEFKQNGINVTESRPGATNVSNLRQESKDGVMNFQKEVGAPITVNGGAESGGPHKQGAKSHANGYKVDIDDTKVVNDYITSNYKFTGTRSDGAALYSDGKGNTYAREKTHWDVCYQCK